VPVDIHSDLDGLMPHELLDISLVGSLGEEDSSKRMPEVMKTKVGGKVKLVLDLGPL
jgi:hypothetical protein